VNVNEVIRAPVVTEKSDKLRESENAYTFEIARQATKNDVKAALKAIYKVDAESIRTAVVRGKNKRVGRSAGRRPNWKKAIVTLKEGQKIDLFDLGV
jgi:large subunit ribosomal protein L23